MTALMESRKQRRFGVQDGGFAALTPQFTVVGRISSISKSGLSFCYVASQERTQGSSKLNIFLTDGSFCCDNVPVKAVWDAPAPGEFACGTITLRHCGVQFGELTHSQKIALDFFIRHFTQKDPVGGASGLCHGTGHHGHETAYPSTPLPSESAPGTHTEGAAA